MQNASAVEGKQAGTLFYHNRPTIFVTRWDLRNILHYDAITLLQDSVITQNATRKYFYKSVRKLRILISLFVRTLDVA